MEEEVYEPVIGLEVHCELKTITKLWCGCKNEFGVEPNTNICPVCLGLPGSLPVLNEQAVKFAAMIGLALNCEVKPSIFHRKNYFYPDMPKDFQISQYDQPINVNGFLKLDRNVTIGVVRAHMEEDTGKTTHIGSSGRIHESSGASIDYNRAGVPLVEIVSAPEIKSAEEAKKYVSELRAILVATNTTDGKMEEGSMRVDANVSVRKIGSIEFGTRTEIKNLNSLRSLVRAIDYEISRQINVIKNGEKVKQETRHWNEDASTTVPLRSKEEADDYRYFPEPDLVEVDLGNDIVRQLKQSLPVMPLERRQRIIELLKNPNEDSAFIVVDLDLDGLLLEVVKQGADAELALKRFSNEFAGYVEEVKALQPERLVELLNLEQTGQLSATQAKAVFAEMLTTKSSPSQISTGLGFGGLEDSELSELLKGIISNCPNEWNRFKDGDGKVQQFFIGQVMKSTKGQANGKVVLSLLEAMKNS